MQKLTSVLLWGLIAGSRTVFGDACPPPSVQAGKVCVLDADQVIGETIELSSFTTLNCRGHAILPSVPGSGVAPASYVPSTPEMAIFVSADRGVEVRNCVIGSEDTRFDFGILAVNSKLASMQGHRISNNEIHAREAGVTVLRVDDARVTDNLITWTNGAGIRVRRNSDRNRVTNNVLYSPGAPPAPMRVVPGGAFFPAGDDGIDIGGYPLQVLYNIVFSGQLYQLPNFEDGEYPNNEQNFIEGNVLSLPGSSVGKTHMGIYVVGNELGTRLVGNTVVSAGVGIRMAGLRREEPVQRVAHCQDADGNDLDRYCQANADCYISGIDPAPIGTCPALQQDVVDLRGRFTVAEGNLLVGPFNSTIQTQRAGIFAGAGTVGGIVRGNEVLAGGIEAGISILGNSIETATIVDNRVSGASIGVLLSQTGATHFGACFAFNDITGSVVRAVGVAGAYTLPTELSCNGSGNYWGHTSPPCFAASDSPDPGLISDSHAYCQPVAQP